MQENITIVQEGSSRSAGVENEMVDQSCHADAVSSD